ncbi:MAG: hypothetical protein J0M24_13940 [Verrucomicrobia bacterium]|nr:hypothetical protein [Verrucomicrobiota bacterium]
MNTPSPDRNVEAVRNLLLVRSQVGLQKYGVTTERTDLVRLDWLRHAQAEALDFAVYLQRLICDELEAAQNTNPTVVNGQIIFEVEGEL